MIIEISGDVTPSAGEPEGNRANRRSRRGVSLPDISDNAAKARPRCATAIAGRFARRETTILARAAENDSKMVENGPKHDRRRQMRIRRQQSRRG